MINKNAFGQPDERFNAQFDKALEKARTEGGHAPSYRGVRFAGIVVAACMLVALFAVPLWMMSENGLIDGETPDEFMPGGQPAVMSDDDHLLPSGGDDRSPTNNYAYALEQARDPNRDAPFYTRDEMRRLVEERDLTQLKADVRQMHIEAELYGGEENVDELPCNNTYYYLIDGWRLCSSCAYVFSKEQDEEIGLTKIPVQDPELPVYTGCYKPDWLPEHEMPYYDGSNADIPVLLYKVEDAPVYVKENLYHYYAPIGTGSHCENNRVWFFMSNARTDRAVHFAEEFTEDGYVVYLFYGEEGEREDDYVIVSVAMERNVKIYFGFDREGGEPGYYHYQND